MDDSFNLCPLGKNDIDPVGVDLVTAVLGKIMKLPEISLNQCRFDQKILLNAFDQSAFTFND